MSDSSSDSCSNSDDNLENSATVHTLSPPLSAYELLREENIKKNNSFLSELNIQTLKTVNKSKKYETLKKLPLRCAKFSKPTILEDRNSNNSDESEIEDAKWNYQRLSTAQQQEMSLTVLEKVGKLFVDR